MITPQKMEGLYYVDIEPVEIDIPDVNSDRIHHFRITKILVRLHVGEFYEGQEFFHRLPYSQKRIWAQPDTDQAAHIPEKCKPPCSMRSIA